MPDRRRGDPGDIPVDLVALRERRLDGDTLNNTVYVNVTILEPVVPTPTEEPTVPPPAP